MIVVTHEMAFARVGCRSGDCRAGSSGAVLLGGLVRLGILRMRG
jgi:hypothetical protein